MMKNQVTPGRIICAILSSALVLLITLWILPYEKGFWFVVKFAYFVLWLISFWFGYLIITDLRTDGRISPGKLRQHKTGLLFVSITWLLLFVHLHGEHRILFDEYSLGHTAMSLHLIGEPGGATIVDGEGGSVFFRERDHVDKRPLYYSFILSVVHGFIGYRPSNAFLLNAVLAFLVLILTYTFLVRRLSVKWACFGVLCIGGLPLYSLSVNSSGYEVFNLLFLVLLVIYGFLYLERGDDLSMNLMITASIMLAHCRSESLIYVLVPVLFWLSRSFQCKRFHLSAFASVSPWLLYIPLFFQRVFRSRPEFVDFLDDSFFSIDHIAGNLREAVIYIIDWRGGYPNSPLVSVVAVGGLIYLFVCARDLIKKRDLDRLGMLSLGAVTLGSVLLVMSHHWGTWTDWMAMRFSLPFQVVFVIMGTSFLHEKLGNGACGKYAVLIASVFIIVWTTRQCSRLSIIDEYSPHYSYNWLRESDELPMIDFLLTEGKSGGSMYGLKSGEYGYFRYWRKSFEERMKSASFNPVVVADYISEDPWDFRKRVTKIHPDMIVDVSEVRRQRWNLFFVKGRLEGVKSEAPPGFLFWAYHKELVPPELKVQGVMETD